MATLSLNPASTHALVTEKAECHDLVEQRGTDPVVVHARRDHHHGDDQPHDVGDDPALTARVLLSTSRSVVAASALFAARTVWKSITTPVGSSARPAFSRTCQRSRSWITWSAHRHATWRSSSTPPTTAEGRAAATATRSRLVPNTESRSRSPAARIGRGQTPTDVRSSRRDPNLRPPNRSAPHGASRVSSTVRLPLAVAGDADCVWSAADEAMLDKI